VGSGPYAIKRWRLEGEIKPRTNHHPQEPYYRLPFANDVIYLAGFFCSGLSYIYEDQAPYSASASGELGPAVIVSRPLHRLSQRSVIISALASR